MADSDVWLRAATKMDGENYYKYVMMYVNDILAVSCDARMILEEIRGTSEFKNDKIEAPDFNLGAKLQKKPLNGIECWTITSQDYVKAAVKKNVTDVERRNANEYYIFAGKGRNGRIECRRDNSLSRVDRHFALGY